ncbi:MULTISPECIES: TonB system transport protein ExbD [Pseudomonas]|jgi:biopolymer transport protein ExbD|uniref:TonB system transport protein ExbD n=1 Tax=Pseudomonas TaxID=286 RepID=UPI001C812ED9|nr:MULTISPECIES: TonB system transport protein ExbD [Pseudomonas]MDG9930778.1 TonB system transport protein ExbD [Pseudomonas sp. GD04042]MDH0481587.1 TonB system transport protein ExbD [Pseudomonas sp. GD04015]MDH0603535.1 TonB system transport protein ExbD [Pseudomonas sp. GD03869]MDH0896585.1 TonB system transport protein ExbD [Pseudomonas sp. GD03875]MDH1066302.1 TonB system transport protein ExbD [Pseudomonas sp. GD03985]
MSLHLHEGGDDLQENHEINVTPFIDVMLVLLIIFMVAAPLATVDVKIDLPASTAKPAPRPDKPIYLSIKEDSALFLDNEQVEPAKLGAALDQRTSGDKDKTIFVRGDKGVQYEELMRVMDNLRGAGYLKIGLVGLETVGAQ